MTAFSKFLRALLRLAAMALADLRIAEPWLKVIVILWTVSELALKAWHLRFN